MERAVIRRPWLAIGGIVLVGAGVVIALGPLDVTREQHRTTLDEDVRRIELDTGSGDVVIRTGDVDRVTVVEQVSQRWGDPEPAHEAADGVLALRECGAWCAVDHEVVVPRGIAVSGGLGSGSLRVDGASALDVEAGSGDVRVADVSGDARVDVGSGDAEFTGVEGTLTAETGSGSVTGRGLRGAVDAEAGSGALDLELAEPADVTASAGSGDVRLAVPRGDYRVEGESGSGDRSVGDPGDPGARHVLTVESDSGDVTLVRR